MSPSSKPAASLSSGLLARKGHARPAMRPQGFVALTPGAQDDLGWNDMGEDAVPPPTVLRQREELAERIAPEPTPLAVAAAETEPATVAPVETAPESVAPAAALPRAKHGTREVLPRTVKAAFTLRLEADRHLRLRLASAVTHQSAQQLVTRALDHFLDTLPEVDGLARQLAGTRARG